MALKPIDLEFFNKEGKNVHESIVAASKRARQVNEDVKIEFNKSAIASVIRPQASKNGSKESDESKDAIDERTRRRLQELELAELPVPPEFRLTE